MAREIWDCAEDKKDMTLLEMAADVRSKKMELDATCSEIRHVGGDWTVYAIASNEAMKVADDGLRNCLEMLNILHQIARERLASAAPGEPPKG